MSNYKFIENGSVTSPLGFVAGGVIAGIKPNNTTKRDLGMIFCEKPCTAAAIFTKNRVKSDTIYVTQEHLKNGVAQAVIVNSGNANACNPDGRTTLSSLQRALSVRHFRSSLSKSPSARLRTA